MTAGKEDEEQKARVIFRHVQKSIRYVAKEMGMGKMVPQKAGEVYQKKYGDCKGCSALLISMLREAGIVAHPAIVRTRDEGRLEKKYVSLDQFNHMIVLARVNDQNVWLDPTAENCPYGSIPWYLQGAEAFFLTEDADFLEIPQTGGEENFITRRIRCQLDPEGTVNLNGKISFEGQRRMEISGQLRQLSPDLREKYIQEYLSESIPDFDRSNCTYEFPDSMELPFEITFQGEISHAATVAGNHIIVRPGKLITLKNGTRQHS